jgi:hypothetical protein
MRPGDVGAVGDMDVYKVEDFDRFLKIFSTKGVEKRKQRSFPMCRATFSIQQT